MKQTCSSNTVKERLQRVWEEISEACEKHGRDPQSISLVAVAKGHDIASIKEAYACGQRDFGESYAQELAQKIEQAAKLGLNDIKWHFIGAIQSNKIKLIAQANIVQSLGSLRHAELLAQDCKKQMPVFLQVKLKDEPLRQGFLPEQLDAAIKVLAGMAQLKLVGLMTILPLEPENKPAHWFSIMRTLRDDLSAKNSLDLALSMGMSDDFAEAVAHGANILRVGTRIFGPRE